MAGNEIPWNTCCPCPKSVYVGKGLLVSDPETNCEVLLDGSYPGIPIDKNGDVQLYNGSDANPIVLPQLRLKNYAEWDTLVIKESDGTITSLAAPDDGLSYAVRAKNGEFFFGDPIGGSLAVEDEGIQITAAASKFNFVGAGVTATDPVEGEVIVNIPGGGSAGPSVIVGIFDGVGFEIEPSTVAPLVYIPVSGTLVSWTIVTDVVGDIVIDVWKTTAALSPPTIADTITNSNEPIVSAASYAQGDPVADAWDSGAAVTAGDVIAFKVISVTGITWASITLEIG